jgi:hypothetical protein
MQFEIERNIPVPRSLRQKMPLEEMEVGDSFLVAASKADALELRPQLARIAREYGNQTGKRFVCRSVDGGVRVWRGADHPVGRLS